MTDDVLLRVSDLQIRFQSPTGTVQAVNGISYQVRRGEVMGLVGESGSGKSVSAYALMGLLPKTARIVSGSARFGERDLLKLSEKEMQNLRGREIGMIFQDPMSSIDPVFRIGDLLSEVIRSHEPSVRKKQAWAQSVDMLRSMGIREAEHVARSYQSALSGGMRQRVMIAAALLLRPKLLIADEPTTALDVTIQDQIIHLLRGERAKSGMSILFITHNFGLVADFCDRVTVMYGGHIMESGSVDDIFYRTAHPYTEALLQAVPSMDPGASEPLKTIDGQPVNPAQLPVGCVFSPRCPRCQTVCRAKQPPETDLGGGHTASCWMLTEGGRGVCVHP